MRSGIHNMSDEVLVTGIVFAAVPFGLKTPCTYKALLDEQINHMEAMILKWVYDNPTER